MKRWIICFLVVILVGCSVIPIWGKGRDKEGCLIISENFCIVVRAPSKQLTFNLGHNPIGVLLKDKTMVTISGNYVAFSSPIKQMNSVIKKYKLSRYTIIE